MQVVLLEKVGRYGKMGDIVKVKDGYARNYLLPRSKALRATKENISIFEARKADLEADNNRKKSEAQKVAAALEALKITIIRQAGDDGRLYGSVTAKDIADAIKNGSVEVDRKLLHLDYAVKSIGEYNVRVDLHSEVRATVKVRVATSEKTEEEIAQEQQQFKSVAPQEAKGEFKRAKKSKSRADTGEDEED